MSGGKNGVQTTVETADRYRLLYSERLGNRPIREIAAKHGMSERRVREIVAEAMAADITVMQSGAAGPKALLTGRKALLEMEQAVELAGSVVYMAIESRNANGATGALRLASERRRELLQLQQAFGLLPDNLANLRWEAVGEDLGRGLLEILREHQMPPEVMQDIAALVGLRQGPDGRYVPDTGRADDAGDA